MLVSTNTQLNILVANSANKVLKEVLKEADVKTITSSPNKDLNVSTLLKTLFKNIQNNSKSNETVLNLLKNSDLNKDLGSFTSNLKSLVKSLPDDKNSEQLKTFLQKFSISPEQTTSKEVKEQIQKSGIFLESKLLNQANNPNNKNENSLLNDMKAILLKTKEQLQGQINNQDKTQAPSQKVEVTPQNNQTTTQNVSKENINIPQTLKQIDKLLIQIKNLETPNTKEQVSKPILNNEQKPNQQSNQQITNQSNTTPQSIKSDSPLLNDIKTILTKVQGQLQGQINNHDKTQAPSQKVEVTPQNNEQQIKSTLQSTSQLLQMKVQLKEEVQGQTQNITKENINIKDTLKQIDKILTEIKKIDPELTKETATKSSTNIDSKISLSTNATIIKTDSPIFNDIKTTLTKIQAQLQQQIQNQIQEPDDLKSHITKEADPKETLKHVDKLLTQIDYHQLYSIANSSNNVYIPFLWDLLEDGSIDIKKIDEEKFYCLIDLTLKDLGKINLHLYLYEDDKLDISVFVEKDDTKKLIRQKVTSLRQELNGTGISVIGLNIHTLKDNTKQDFYKQNDDFDFGVNIKV